MKSGRVIGAAIVVSALVGGAAIYYLQIYAYYERLPAQERFALTPLGAVEPETFPVSGFRGIDSDTSPLRYRACFTLNAPPATFLPHRAPAPLNAPAWFDCFDAAAIGADLQDGTARAYVGEAHFEYGFDRVVAVYPDGRAFAWHQMNACGDAVFDGLPAPAGCPPPPEDM